MALSMNVVILLYLIASVFFIQALKGLSHPSTSRRGTPRYPALPSQATANASPRP